MMLFDALRHSPYAFSFFQALRRFECEYPQQPRLGQTLHPKQDRIRLGQDPSLAFAASTLASFRQDKQHHHHRCFCVGANQHRPNGGD